MITFSLRPSRVSTLPFKAASISTRAVSWKDAADRKLSVVRDDLVTPRSRGWAVAGSPSSAKTSVVQRGENHAVDQLGGELLAVARQSIRTYAETSGGR